MSKKSGLEGGNGAESQLVSGALGWNLSRRGLLGAGALLGLAATMRPAERAFAWSSWTNATSPALKSIGMGDCVHEDLVQISYARVVSNHVNDSPQLSASVNSLLNPWAGKIREDKRYADIAGDTVDRGEGKIFTNADDLAARLYRENLAYLRIGSFWNDAAANTLLDFGASCAFANSVPKFSGNDYYEGAWDVGQHLKETNAANKKSTFGDYDALVQFTMNDRNNFIHGMLSSTASHSQHLKQSEIKKYALQWLGVAYEYARTGEVTVTSDLKADNPTDVVAKERAQKIFDGFIDTYGQLDDRAHDMCVSLQVGEKEASIKLPHRRLRLRALGMMCHTMEDFWCPAHTCRTYHTGSSDFPENSILAFSNYKLQNGKSMPMFGYHIPFDRYAVSDAKNYTNWREALTRGDMKDSGSYPGTETLANALDSRMQDPLANAHTYFNTLGMNETIDCITTLLNYLYTNTPWDGTNGVRTWVDETVMPTRFDGSGQSYVCDAGRRSLHTPTYIIAPIKAMKRAYRKAGLSDAYNNMIAAAQSYDEWQKGAHRFFSGRFNTTKSKFITTVHEGDNVWNDAEGEARLVALAERIHQGTCALNADKKSAVLSRIGSNGCLGMVSAINMVSGMLQEFNIDLRGSLRSSDDGILKMLKEARTFFVSGLGDQAMTTASHAAAAGLLAANIAYADEGDEDYTTANMALEDFVKYEDGSYLIAVRDMDSLMTSIMEVPASTPGADKLEEGLANLTIKFKLETEFDDDPDFYYTVTEIDYPDDEERIYLVTGTVKSVSENKKSLVLDLNGLSEFELGIQDRMTDIPQAGEYICAHYTFGNAGLELADYDELDTPGPQKTVKYPVAKVAGSRAWLLENQKSEDGAEYSDYLQIEYNTADVHAILQEGYMATVVYHDEAYGDVTDVDENSLLSAGIAGSFPTITVQEGEGGSTEDADLTDSPATPGYLDLGDDYGALNYGNEVLHVADAIVCTDEVVDEKTLCQLFGYGYTEKKASPQKPVEYRYYSNNDGTHRKYSVDLAESTEENCTYNAAGVCALCGYAKPSEGGTKPADEKTPAQTPALKTQNIKVNTTAKRIRAARLKKKARFTSKVKVKGAKTKVTYKRLKKGSSPRLAINPKTGKIKVRRGTPKGTYRIKIKVTAVKTAKFRAASKVVTIKVKVI